MLFSGVAVLLAVLYYGFLVIANGRALTQRNQPSLQQRAEMPNSFRKRTAVTTSVPDNIADLSRFSTEKTRENRPPPQAVGMNETSLASEFKLASELGNRGNKSAVAAVETFLWATVNGQTDACADLIAWRWLSAKGLPSEQTVSGMFANVPEPWRQEVKTPERLLALMHQNDLQAIGGFEIVKRAQFTPDSEEIQVRLYDENGNTKVQSMFMRRTESGWKREQWPITIQQIADKLRNNVIKTPPR